MLSWKQSALSDVKEVEHTLGARIGRKWKYRHTCVTAGLQSTDTSTVFTPFVFPETLVVSIFVQPVLIHVREKVCLPI